MMKSNKITVGTSSKVNSPFKEKANDNHKLSNDEYTLLQRGIIQSIIIINDTNYNIIMILII